MKIKFCLGLLVLMGVALPVFTAADDIEWTETKSVRLEKPALDVAVSSDGKMMYILSKGEIRVYSFVEEKVIKTIPVDAAFDRVAAMMGEEELILSSSSKRMLKRMRIEKVHDIDVFGLPFKGSEKAPVVIAVFDDYQCPYCTRLNPILEAVLKKYPKEVKLVIKHFPLRFHKYGQKASMAALAAANQGKFWEFHDELFKQSAGLTDGKILQIAGQLKLDVERFKKDKESEKIKKMVEKDMADGRRIGVGGTPSVYINGKFLKQRHLQGFEMMIERELKKTQKQ